MIRRHQFTGYFSGLIFYHQNDNILTIESFFNFQSLYMIDEREKKFYNKYVPL